MMPFRTDVGRVAERLPDPVARIGLDGRVQWRNDRFRELLEGDGPARLGRPLRELVEAGERSVVDTAVTEMTSGAVTADARVRVRGACGGWVDGVFRFLRTPTFDDHPPFVTVLVKLG